MIYRTATARFSSLPRLLFTSCKIPQSFTGLKLTRFGLHESTCCCWTIGLSSWTSARRLRLSNWTGGQDSGCAKTTSHQYLEGANFPHCFLSRPNISGGATGGVGRTRCGCRAALDVIRRPHAEFWLRSPHRQRGECQRSARGFGLIMASSGMMEWEARGGQRAQINNRCLASSNLEIGSGT